ncbi:MAG TPA: ParB/RepB/Spo0J family partition protein [Candidatus Dormibacteraeota bacterium]|jgi:ParB/RepB/Spo0J family partition protein
MFDLTTEGGDNNAESAARLQPTVRLPAAPVPAPSGHPQRAPEHRRIPLSLIELDPAQPRRDARTGIDELAASMEANGLLQPVVVAGWPDATRAGHYRVVAGERRVRAARVLGWTEVDAFILAPGSRRFVLSVTENIQRRDLSREERKHAFARILDECGGDKAAAATLLGVSQTTFYRTIADAAAEAYANWSPRGSLKRLEKAAQAMPPDRRRELAAELRSLADRLEAASTES